jgi:hypothetical protein
LLHGFVLASVVVHLLARRPARRRTYRKYVELNLGHPGLLISNSKVALKLSSLLHNQQLFDRLFCAQ